MVEKVIIMGAAGRDFHNFNVYFKDNPRYRVIAFTAAQIPAIENRTYPPELSGKLYPQGVPIHPEEELVSLIKGHKVDLVAMSYSDLPHIEVMHKASLAMAHGADFILIGATYTMLKSSKPVVAVCAVRTGCGKSQTTRKVCKILKKQGRKVVAVRHPMPYGDLLKQVMQRFSCLEDLKTHNCTIEEQEEYEPLIEAGITVFAGVDYGEILLAAEKEADVIVWDGGNNDTPFYRPDMHVVLLDPHRPGHELNYYPGETNLIMAQAAIINKIDTADAKNVEQVRQNILQAAPKARIILAKSPFLVRDPSLITGKRVLVVEDGPTLTHGGMAHGAGLAAASAHGAAEIVDPRPFAQGSIKQAFCDYPHMGPVTPALGYSAGQIEDLEKTITLAECDLVLFATPIQLTRVLSLNKPAMRVRYEYQDAGEPTLEEVMRETLPDLFSKQG
ncbi:cyclic 2,3-diphosphoglycerate synthase [Dethiosulfatarculus sandiegensis]|uniref:GTPase n=1 Tax=Dethiosulfatarculus sandiegensis TaxID=1429043 RepID=A0A0D2HPK8_9BACT|nr:cyclic 2,3-diphosphoglycerate synthase [Dethiosulfatarculus sandiegensis]KIX12433.1 GTPase [Dethiosulfatarculus sandiegensis]